MKGIVINLLQAPVAVKTEFPGDRLRFKERSMSHMSLTYGGAFTKPRNFFIKLLKLPVSKYRLGRISTIVMPVMIGVVGIKTYKIIFALWPVTRSTLDWNPPTLMEGCLILLISPLGFLGLAYLGIYFFLWRRALIKSRIQAILLLLSPLILLPIARILWYALKGRDFAGELSGMYQVTQVYVDAFSDIQFLLGMYRDDIFFLIGYGLIFSLIFNIAPSQWRRLVFSLFICFNIVILAIAGLELAHYLKTGMNGNIAILNYFLAHADDLWNMEKDEINSQTLLAMLLPLFLILLSPLIIKIFANHPGGESQRDKTVLNAGKLIWICLLATILIPKHVNQEYVRLRGNIILSFGRELLFQPDIPFEAFKEGEALRHAAMNLGFVPTAGARHKNIVIMLLESVRADATSVYNPLVPNTPFLQNLSKKSLVAKEMYTVIPRTAAAWVSVLNGTYPSTNSALMHWAYQESNHPKFASLPRLLRKAGYKSAFFVPTHLDYENEGQLLDNMGFDQIVSKKDYVQTSYEVVNSFGFEDKVMIEPILSWVDTQRKNHSPFFLTIMTNVGHEKYNLPSTWKRENFAANSNEDYNNYLNCIAYIDDFIKQTLSEFQRRNLFEDTIFFILGDHGDAFGEHGTRERALSMYEEALHIPLLIFAPSLFSEGGTITGPRQQIDIFPTIIDLLGFSSYGEQPPGISLLRDNPKDRELYYGSILEGVAIGMRVNSRKYIYKIDSDRMEVFDLEKDPEERHDLASEISQTEVLKAKNQMLTWYEATKVALTATEPDQGPVMAGGESPIAKLPPDAQQPSANDSNSPARKVVLSVPENDKKAK
jgi:lipoteichoic acid synthase